MGFPSITKVLFGPLVPVIRIEGIITTNTTNSIGNKLKKINTTRTEGLAVVMDSRGGSTAQCHAIRNQLLQFSTDNKIPLYCFAENFATHGNQIIQALLNRIILNRISNSSIQYNFLQLKVLIIYSVQEFEKEEFLITYLLYPKGNQVFVNPTSIVGNASEPQADVDFSNFFQKYDVESRLIASNPLVNEFRFNWALKDNEKDRQFIQSVTDKLSKMIFGDIQFSRGQRLKAGSELLTKEFTGKQAINNGLADKVGTYEAVLAENFPLAKLDHTSLTQWSFISSYQWNAKFGKAIPLFLLVSLFGLKVLIKYTLIVQSYLMVSANEEEEKKKKESH